ncbi:hypothetical protein LSCM1_02770 [Leishmania martiniquensis]|uniref:Signal recognition particle receptor subunit beta n=1 Tax=Leishmania martiniquensis TaxID=1580590 RepID=A0A836GKV0_9TRYP|nr:hypothetical protein LSCM1_02770 [Leishmania martiniquensis]
MSVLDAVVVNQTIIEAVRVALEQYTAGGHQITAKANAAGMPTEQENVIRGALLAGLKSYWAAAQQHATGVASQGSAKEMEGSAHSHPVGAMTAIATRTLSAALEQLQRNATATQEVVQQALLSIGAHLRSVASHRGDDDESIAAAAVYAATPEVTRALEAALSAQSVFAADGVKSASVASPVEARGGVAQLSGLSAVQWVWLLATLVLGYVLVSFVFGRLLGFGGALNRRRPRSNTVLIGLPDSGKTALFMQLVHHQQLLESRTSMHANIGYMCAAAQYGLSKGAKGVRVVDFPGHPRLREGMLRAISEAVNVVVVIDAITVQDSQQEGVSAVAELLFSVLQAPEFYGVQRLLFACTKRDEITSYTSKSVRKLLEAAMVTSIASRQNVIGRVESVRDSSNTVITGEGKSGSGRHGGRRYLLSLDATDNHDLGSEAAAAQGHLRGASGVSAKSFSFEQLGIPIAFVDVSSRPNVAEHKYSVTAVEDFLLRTG